MNQQQVWRPTPICIFSNLFSLKITKLYDKSFYLQSVVSAALRAVGNIVTGDDIQTQVSASLTRARAFKLMHALSHSFTDSQVLHGSEFKSGFYVVSKIFFPNLINKARKNKFKHI